MSRPAQRRVLNVVNRFSRSPWNRRNWYDLMLYRRPEIAIMSQSRIGIAAVCVAYLLLGSPAFAQSTKLSAQASGRPSTEDIIGGTIFGPDGVTHIVGDGMGGGFIFGPDGFSTFVSNGTGGGTLYAPNTSGSIISDGMGGGILYSTKKGEPASDRSTSASPKHSHMVGP